jgi:hypothetical protein
MRRFGAITLVWLSVSRAANCWQLRQEGGVVSQHDPELRIELSPSMIEDMGGFNFVQAALANATLPGKPRTARHNQFNGLEARQTAVCLLCSPFLESASVLASTLVPRGAGCMPASAVDGLYVDDDARPFLE